MHRPRRPERAGPAHRPTHRIARETHAGCPTASALVRLVSACPDHLIQLNIGTLVDLTAATYRLSAERVAALEAIPRGWQWHPYDATWQHLHTLAQREVAERGSLAHLGPHSVVEGVKLGRRVSTQRARHRAGRLAPDRIAALPTMLRAQAVTHPGGSLPGPAQPNSPRGRRRDSPGVIALRILLDR